MKPALEKFLLIAATLAAIGIFIYAALWTSISGKKTQMDNLFNSTNVPTSFLVKPATTGATPYANTADGQNISPILSDIGNEPAVHHLSEEPMLG